MNRWTWLNRGRTMVVTLTALFGLVVSSGEGRAAPRDLLWETVSSCLDTTALGYCSDCRIPRTGVSCPGRAGCDKTLEVWAESNNYVAVRDRKMCGCPEGFVHGLVIPRAKVTGVEDSRRPSGIWGFAWEVARARIREPATIALVVNPRHHRSQDQLHVHIVRLKKDARQQLGKLRQVRVDSLEKVWGAARENAAAGELYDYSVLVASCPEGGYLVTVDPESLEKPYTEALCR